MNPTTRAPKSWCNLDTHYLSALEDPWYQALAGIQDAITLATYRFFSGEKLRYLHLPITTHSISSPMGLGSDSLPVQINLFGVDTYLADSMQFMLEYGTRLHKPGCYYLMPSFRGEQADESHLCQFIHSEAEITGSQDDVMALVESYLRSMSAHILDTCGELVQQIAGTTEHIEKLVALRALPRISVDDAAELLGNQPELVRTNRELGFRTITRPGEQALMREFGGFVWLTEPDHLAVPFYQAFADESGKKARAADLLFGLGEVVGCGERHSSAEQVQTALDHHGIDHEPYHWYVEMRRKYPLQTSGFGLGTERYICWLLRHTDVRDCQILPRFNGVVTIP